MSGLMLWGVQALVVMMKAKEAGMDKVLAQQADDLYKRFTPMLPPPPNGDKWTVADLEAMQGELEAVNQRIIERAQRP